MGEWHVDHIVFAAFEMEENQYIVNWFRNLSRCGRREPQESDAYEQDDKLDLIRRYRACT